MTEQLVTCSGCGTANFTTKGLKAHRCKGVNRSLAVTGTLPLALTPLETQLENSVSKIRDYHRISMYAANQAVAAAVFAGLELRAVQKRLKGKKSAPGCTFEEFLDRNQKSLGFSRRTAFKYTALAEKVKGKLLKQDAELDRILSLAPSQMLDCHAKVLLKALHKSVSSETLTELYHDFGIVKLPHGAGLGKETNKTPEPSPNDPKPKPTPELLIQDELFTPLDRVIEYWNSPINLGESKVQLWEMIEKPKLREYINKMREMIAEAEEALKKK